MFAASGLSQLVQHFLIHNVGTALQGRQEAATAHHCIQLANVMSRLVERGFNLRRSKLPLVKNRTPTELLHLRIRMLDVVDEHGPFIQVKSELGGSGAGIYGENLEFTGRQRSPPRRWNSPCRRRSPLVME